MEGKGGSSNGDDEAPDVLSSLPATRPSKLSRRAAARTTADTPTPSKAESAADKALAARASSPEKAKGARSEPRAATGARAKAAAGEAGAKAKAPAKAGAKARPARAAADARPPAEPPTPLPAAGSSGPRPVRAGHPGLEEPAGKAAEQRREEPAPGGTGLVKTVVQAAGELASIGVTVGGQIVKRAAEKLPRKP